jgi:hypothetical protein
MPEGRQHLGLDIEADHIGLAATDSSHGNSGGGGVCDVGRGSSSIGQETAHKCCVVRRNRRHDTGGKLSDMGAQGACYFAWPVDRHGDPIARDPAAGSKQVAYQSA